jgi:hypothetical protein
LVYAYTSGKTDLAKINHTRYLYCTDEHTILNALCNQFDYGNTPTEILMSLIENYDTGFWTRNYRYDRAYWDTSGYNRGIFKTMFNIKKFLLLYSVGFNTTDQVHNLGGAKIADDNSLKYEIVPAIQQDMRQAVKLSLAFYTSVLQQVASERDWRTEYSNFTGKKTFQGIAADKIFAMFFLMGDDTFVYNPSIFIY